jgi:hypothetical protein
MAAILGAGRMLLAATGCSAQASDEQRFVAEMVAQLKQRMPGLETMPRKDPLSAGFKINGRQEMTVNFQRVFGYCQHAALADCAAARDSFVDNIVRYPVPPAPTPASLRIAVRDAEYVSHVPAYVATPIGDDLFAILLSDSPGMTATVPPEALAGLGLTREQAWERAWRQTKAALPSAPTPALLAKGAVILQDQPFLASLLADTKAWRALADAAGPDLLLTVVADDLVFVARMPDGASLERFKRSVQEDCATQPRCISPNVYRFRDGRWVVSR